MRVLLGNFIQHCYMFCCYTAPSEKRNASSFKIRIWDSPEGQDAVHEGFGSKVFFDTNLLDTFKVLFLFLNYAHCIGLCTWSMTQGSQDAPLLPMVVPAETIRKFLTILLPRAGPHETPPVPSRETHVPDIALGRTTKELETLMWNMRDVPLLFACGWAGIQREHDWKHID